MNRLYSSFQSTEWLSEKKITMFGTLQQNGIGVPPVLKDTKARDFLSSETHWKEGVKVDLSSYVFTTSKKRKKNVMISTLEPLHAVTDDDKKKLYKPYDFIKGGIDMVDQKMGSYTVKAKSRKWTKVAFSYLLDTIRVNASTVFVISDGKNLKKINAFLFGMIFTESLVRSFVEQRLRNSLNEPILPKTSLFIGEISAPPSTEKSTKFVKYGKPLKKCST